jgi:predicted transcriptional regulator
MATRYTPDFIDQLILLLISAGGNSCSYLAETLGIAQPSVVQRQKRLEDLGLVQSVNTRQRQTRRKYRLTEQGEKEVTINHVMFEIRMLNLKRTND